MSWVHPPAVPLDQLLLCLLKVVVDMNTVYLFPRAVVAHRQVSLMFCIVGPSKSSQYLRIDAALYAEDTQDLYSADS